jgi:hypothetical protein
MKDRSGSPPQECWRRLTIVTWSLSSTLVLLNCNGGGIPGKFQHFRRYTTRGATTRRGLAGDCVRCGRGRLPLRHTPSRAERESRRHSRRD